MGKTWLSSGGAYWLIFVTWFAVAIAQYIFAARLAKALRAENDGCLLGLGNVLLTFVGGGIGLLLAPFPAFVMTSMAGAFLLPMLPTWLWVRRHRLTSGR